MKMDVLHAMPRTFTIQHFLQVAKRQGISEIEAKIFLNRQVLIGAIGISARRGYVKND